MVYTGHLTHTSWQGAGFASERRSRRKEGGARMGRSARRVRLAAIAVALAIGFMFGSMVEAFEMPSSVEPSSDVPAARQSAATVVVMPGDSLWSIARVHAPEGMDVRKYVHALRKANGLEGSVLHAGQTLVLP